MTIVPKIIAVPFSTNAASHGFWFECPTSVLMPSSAVYRDYRISGENVVCHYNLQAYDVEEGTIVRWYSNLDVLLGEGVLLSAFDTRQMPVSVGFKDVYAIFTFPDGSTYRVDMRVRVAGFVPDVMVSFEYTDYFELYVSYNGGVSETLVTNYGNSSDSGYWFRTTSAVPQKKLYEKRSFALC